jgi:hypothetical protein
LVQQEKSSIGPHLPLLKPQLASLRATMATSQNAKRQGKDQRHTGRQPPQGERMMRLLVSRA